MMNRTSPLNMSAIYPSITKSRLKNASPKFRILLPERPNLLISPRANPYLPDGELGVSFLTDANSNPMKGQQSDRTLNLESDSHNTFSHSPERGRLAFKLSALRTLSTKELTSDASPHVHNKYRASIKVFRSPIHQRPLRRYEHLINSSFLAKCPQLEPIQDSQFPRRKVPRRKLRIDLSSLALVSVATETEEDGLNKWK
mmetsp:Transcript_27301/g.49080  ORF Transcript_27301/g.49080 Transcript_27301/m.49080 type:complete len:200 (+) Transcript_27301:732-1331(+)